MADDIKTPAATNQPNQQPTAQPPATPTAQDGQPPVDDSQFVRVERRNFAKHAEDGDFNKVIHKANRYEEARSLAREYGYDDPADFLKALKATPSDDQPARGTPASQQPTSLGQEDPNAQPMTRAEFQAWQSQQAQREQDAYWQGQYQSSKKEADTATQAAIAELAGEGKKAKVMFGGAEREVNVSHRQVRGLFNEMLADVLDETFAGQANADAMKRWPSTPDMVKEAASRTKSMLALQGTSSAERTADAQRNIPSAGLGGGGGGRAQKDFRDMSPEERAHSLARAVEAKTGRKIVQ